MIPINIIAYNRAGNYLNRTSAGRSAVFNQPLINKDIIVSLRGKEHKLPVTHTHTHTHSLSLSADNYLNTKVLAINRVGVLLWKHSDEASSNAIL